MKPDALTLSETSVRQCGGKPPPLICAFDDEYNSNKSMVEVTVPHVISLFFYFLIAMLHVSPLTKRTLFRLNGNQPFPIYQWARIAFKGFSICIESGLVTLVIIYPVTLAGMGTLGLSVVVDFSDWNFGQVIAVSIWIPVILKYIYWSLCRFLSLLLRGVC